MQCPKCGLNQTDTNLECLRCGVVFAKLRRQVDVVQSPESEIDEVQPESTSDFAPEPRHLDNQGWIMLVSGSLIALVCFAFFWLQWTLGVFKTLVHEMGHAIFGWAFGYPSFPAFDLIWGGGVTMHTDRSTTLLIVVYLLLIGLVFTYRKNLATMVVLMILIFFHSLFSYTMLHSALILFMGHGTELVIAGIFIYRSLSGRAIVHAVERPLYAIIGFFVVFADIGFAYRLLTSASERLSYADAKGGDLEMDFIRIARDHLNVDMTSVVSFFLIWCFLTPLLAFLAFRYEEYIHSVVVRLWRREPAA